MQKAKNKTEEKTYGYGARPFASVTSTVLDCVCGAKYIKTRRRQTACLKCTLGSMSRRRS